MRDFEKSGIKRVDDNFAEEYVKKAILNLKETIGEDKRDLLALSGGVDSSVCAAMLSKAIGNRLICIFVDHGLMRKDEAKEVQSDFSKAGLELEFICVDREKRFLTKLKGVTDPELKRKIIGEEFIRVFEEESLKLGDVDFLAQGTIYPDIIESGGVKSHHNVGGLPKNIRFNEIIEPLKELYKDEVRSVGKALGLPASLVDRQPFPGPGLAVRCIGEVVKEKLDMLREADAIFRAEVDKWANETGEGANQYFAVITDMKSVGVKNDKRTYGYVATLRAVKTEDFMGATVVRLPYELLERACERITAKVDGITRVVYDITSKPPGTIEWE